MDVFILSACRTPSGRLSGGLSGVPAHYLGSVAIHRAFELASASSGIDMHVLKSKTSEVFIGQVLTAGCGQNPARQASLTAPASLPHSIPCTTINLLCGSGLRAVMLGAQAIISGQVPDGRVVVAGGEESMSRAPHLVGVRSDLARFRLGDVSLADSMRLDGLEDAFHHMPMGVTAEFIAKEYEISREEQDLYALRSQRLASQAHARGYFAAELVPVDVGGYVPYVPPIPLLPSGGIASKLAAFELREHTDTTGWPLPLLLGTPLPSAASLAPALSLVTCPSAPALAHAVNRIGTEALSCRTGVEPGAEPTPLVKTSKGKWVTADETIRHEITLDSLRKLAPVFAQDAAIGSVTAGNASSINDAAACVLLASGRTCSELSLRPIARLVSFAQSAVEPIRMGVAPVYAIHSALAKAQWQLEDVDLLEINEAFASTSIACLKELGITLPLASYTPPAAAAAVNGKASDSNASAAPKCNGSAKLVGEQQQQQNGHRVTFELDEAGDEQQPSPSAASAPAEWDQRVNVCGGAIALGHAIGASGARVLVTLVHSLRRRNARRGLVALCIGGGMGIAACVEAVYS